MYSVYDVSPVNLVLFELQVGHCNELIQLELCFDNLSLAWRVRPTIPLPAVDPRIKESC